MSNLLEQAINCDDPDQVAKIISDALGIESDVSDEAVEAAAARTEIAAAWTSLCTGKRCG